MGRVTLVAMDTATINSRKQSLKKAIGKSLKGLRVGKNGKLSSIDKRKIKSTVAKAYQRYLLNELTTPSTKTYDWWFTVDGKYVDGISHQRNMLGRNRYFIIDLGGVAIPIDNDFSFASTVGSQRVRELEIHSHEISTIISSSKALFAGMMDITVSAAEDKKISDAYDTIDEKLIISVTIGAPIAMIGAAEAIPAAIVLSESSAFSSFTTSIKGMFSFSTKGAGARMAYETGSEFFANGGDVGEMNVLSIPTSAFGSNIAAEFIGSKYSLSLNKGFETANWNETAVNLAIGRVNSNFESKLGDFSKVLGDSGSVKALNMTFTLAGQTGTKFIGEYGIPKE